jgi:predicted nucleic acid-binding protein
VENARRESVYQQILATYRPIPYSAEAARVYGALCAAVRLAGRNPRPRRLDLLIASVAAEACRC